MKAKLEGIDYTPNALSEKRRGHIHSNDLLGKILKLMNDALKAKNISVDNCFSRTYQNCVF